MPGLANSDLRASGQGAQTQPTLTIEPATGGPFDGFWHLSFVEASSGRAKMFHMMSSDQGATWIDGNAYTQRINNSPQVHIRDLSGSISTGMATNEFGPELECWVSDYEDDGGFAAPQPAVCEWNADYDTNITRTGGFGNSNFVEANSCENDNDWSNPGTNTFNNYSYATTGLKRVGARYTDNDGAVGCGVIWVPVNLSLIHISEPTRPY